MVQHTIEAALEKQKMAKAVSEPPKPVIPTEVLSDKKIEDLEKSLKVSNLEKTPVFRANF